jgi:uncharacterized oligopeptide transporter (OPT) family protein
VAIYDTSQTDPLVDAVPANTCSTLVLAHMLEHFTDADHMVRTILRSAGTLNIDRVIFVVPGAKGFQFDSTHRTFVKQALP